MNRIKTFFTLLGAFLLSLQDQQTPEYFTNPILPAFIPTVVLHTQLSTSCILSSIF